MVGGRGRGARLAFVSSDGTRLLIDAGLSVADTRARLKAIGEDLDEISAVLVTHPHLDHAGGLANLVRHWRRAGRLVPVYCTWRTYDALKKGISPHWYRNVAQFDTFEVGAFHCETFTVKHDCGDPLGFTVADREGNRATFALDLGEIDSHLGEYLAMADFLLLESNHDPDMLAAGPYAYTLKQRISKFHLSNSAACQWITDHMSSRTHNLYLGHLSTTTNDPNIVRLMADQAIAARVFDQPPVVTVILPGEGPSPPLLVGQDQDTR